MTYTEINETSFPEEYLPEHVTDQLIRKLAQALLAAWFPNSYPAGDDALNWGSIACEDVERVLDALPAVLDEIGEVDEPAGGRE
jgi:hypothetical protein